MGEEDSTSLPPPGRKAGKCPSTMCWRVAVFCCSLVRRTYAQAVYRPRKDTLFKTKIDKIDTLIKTKNDKIDTLIKTKNDKIDTLFKTKIPKNIPWLAARPP